MNKKQYKQMKHEIVTETAIEVGYSYSILEKIPSYALLEAMKKLAISGYINNNTDHSDLQNMLVTESVKEMNYQDFKDIASYFFSYNRYQTA